MRHFGFRQNIPSGPINLDDAHKEDMRERMNKIWEEHHQRWIVTWNDQHNRIVNGIQFKKKRPYVQQQLYLIWYINHIIRYLDLISYINHTICYLGLVEESLDDKAHCFSFISNILMISL